MNDQGLEKVSDNLKQIAWQNCLQVEKSLAWHTYKQIILQPHLDGTTNQFEAQRLFWAEQIKANFFFYESPNSIAEQLSNDIQTVFQNIIKPISIAENEEEQIKEILFYYFPSNYFLNQFQKALEQKLEQKKENTIKPEINNKINNKITERPKIIAYLNHQEINLPDRIKKVVNNFYSNF